MPRSWPHSKPLLAVTHSWANPGESRCGNSVAGPIFFSQPCGQQALSDGFWRGASSSGQEACISPAPAAAPPALPCPALPEGRCPPGEERRGFVPPAGSLWRSLLKGTLCIIAFFLLFIFFFFSIFLDVSKLGTAFCEGKFCWLNFFVA